MLDMLAALPSSTHRMKLRGWGWDSRSGTRDRFWTALLFAISVAVGWLEQIGELSGTIGEAYGAKTSFIEQLVF